MLRLRNLGSSFAIGVAVDFVQIALEESPLNEVTYDDALTPSRISTNLLYPPARSARVAPSPTHLRRNDELRGIRGEVKRLIEGFEPVALLTERAYADDLTFLFELMGFTGVHTAGDGIITDPDGGTIPAGAHRWVYSKRDSIDAQTARMRVNYATENVLMELYGAGISSASLNMAGELSTDWMGLFMRRLAADEATVPAVAASAIPPFRRGDLFISALAGGGRLSDWTVNITNPLERVNSASLTPSSDWPDALEHGDEEVAVAGTIPKRVLTAADIDALIAATSFSMTARWISDKLIGATAEPYGLWIQMPACQYTGGDVDEIGAKRRFGFSPDWMAHYDEGVGYDARITLINGVAAIKTFA